MSSLKAKLIALGAFLLSVVAFFLRLKVVTNQRDRAQQAATKYKLWSERQRQTSEIDAEIEQQFSHRADEARKDRQDGQVPRNLSDPDNF